ncbi:hypothetical protein Hanom_Chr15g01380671 [Helianthus anomalus]
MFRVLNFACYFELSQFRVLALSFPHPSFLELKPSEFLCETLGSISVPVLRWMIMQDMHLPVFIGLVMSGETDWFDRYVARKMGRNFVVCSSLVPLADRVPIGCVTMAMVERGPSATRVWYSGN